MDEASWIQVLGAIVGVLTALGAGLRWLLTWLFAELKKVRDEYTRALKLQTDTFDAQLKEREKRVDEERDARLADKDRHAGEMRELVDLFREALTSKQSERPKPRDPFRSNH